jgi:hypothetical protein
MLGIIGKWMEKERWERETISDEKEPISGEIYHM